MLDVGVVVVNIAPSCIHGGVLDLDLTLEHLHVPVAGAYCRCRQGYWQDNPQPFDGTVQFSTT